MKTNLQQLLDDQPLRVLPPAPLHRAPIRFKTLPESSETRAKVDLNHARVVLLMFLLALLAYFVALSYWG